MPSAARFRLTADELGTVVPSLRTQCCRSCQQYSSSAGAGRFFPSPDYACLWDAKDFYSQRQRAGAVVNFTATANDAVDGAVPVTCRSCLGERLWSRHHGSKLFGYRRCWQQCVRRLHRHGGGHHQGVSLMDGTHDAVRSASFRRSLRILCRRHPRRPTPPASTALAGSGRAREHCGVISVTDAALHNPLNCGVH
jgi:hypothetical protein